MKKNSSNKHTKKLTRQDFVRMWGDEGPYSQVRVSEEIRILDDSVSRVFKVIEAEINPFTFEYVYARRNSFVNDVQIQQLLDHAENRGKFGYVVSAGEVEAGDPSADGFVHTQKEMIVQTVIRMHRYVIEQCELGLDKHRTLPSDKELMFAWNDVIGKVEMVSDDMEQDTNARTDNSLGVAYDKVRMFFILPFANGIPAKQSTMNFIKALKKATTEFNVDIEDVESFQEYIFIMVNISFEVSPEDFVLRVINDTNGHKKNSVFHEAYLVTNAQKPTPQEITKFLVQVLPKKKKRKYV